MSECVLCKEETEDEMYLDELDITVYLCSECQNVL